MSGHACTTGRMSVKRAFAYLIGMLFVYCIVGLFLITNRIVLPYESMKLAAY